MSTDRMTALLARLDAWLAMHRPRFARGLLGSATPDQLAALERDLGQPLPHELHRLLAWHNGQSPDVPGAFILGFHLLSTNQIVQVKKELDGDKALHWHPAWLPFLDDDNDNYMCLDTRQPGCPVRECWRGRPVHEIVAGSLTVWLEQFVTALEKGEYVEDPERGDLIKKG